MGKRGIIEACRFQSTSFHQFLWIEHNLAIPRVMIAALHATTHAGQSDHLYGRTSRTHAKNHLHHVWEHGRNCLQFFEREKRPGIWSENRQQTIASKLSVANERRAGCRSWLRSSGHGNPSPTTWTDHVMWTEKRTKKQRIKNAIE